MLLDGISADAINEGRMIEFAPQRLVRCDDNIVLCKLMRRDEFSRGSGINKILE